jgi:6-phosphogluconolactonase
MIELEVRPDLSTFMRTAAERVVTLAETSITARGHFTIALSGGSTPKALFELLAGEYLKHVDWPNVHVFWGDERCVPPEHPDSNYRMARLALLDYVPIPMSNIHRMRGEIDPLEAADQYEIMLREFFLTRGRENEPAPRFDLILLGMGDDGHTASLFPGTEVLHEQERWVTAHYVEKLDAWRITLTAVAINAASNILFLVTGQGKAETLRAVASDPYQPDALPSQMIEAINGRTVWLVDAAAASLL